MNRSSHPQVSVVIPAPNEARNLEIVLPAIARVLARVRPSVHGRMSRRVISPHAGRGERAQKRLAQHWVSLAVAVLPPQWRERYDEEWRNELNELVGRARLHYAAHQFVSAWSLQRALRGRSPALEPGKDSEKMTTASATLGRLGAGVLGGFAVYVQLLLLAALAAMVVVTIVLVAVISLVAALVYDKAVPDPYTQHHRAGRAGLTPPSIRRAVSLLVAEIPATQPKHAVVSHQD